MKGISFGKYHTYDDFGLIVTKREIASPTPKTHYVEIDGADGSLDFTEAFGDVKYKRRTLKYSVASTSRRGDFWVSFTEVQNKLHGKEFRITDDEDSDYFYIGRVSIDKWSIDKAIGSFTITVDAEPYKYHQSETLKSFYITGTKEISIRNDRMSVNPLINVISEATITIGGTSYIVAESTDEIILKAGINKMTVSFTSGSGTISFRYREGAL